MAVEDHVKTAFVTSFGLHQFRVMPFGLKGALATFQRMMYQLIQGKEKFTSAYLDDLVIYSDTVYLGRSTCSTWRRLTVFTGGRADSQPKEVSVCNEPVSVLRTHCGQ